MLRALLVRMALMSTQREHFFPRVIRAIQAEMMMTALSTASAARMLRLVAKADKLKAKASLASKAKTGFRNKLKNQRAAKSVAGTVRQRTLFAAGAGPLVGVGVGAAAARKPSTASTQSQPPAPPAPPGPAQRSAATAADVRDGSSRRATVDFHALPSPAAPQQAVLPLRLVSIDDVAAPTPTASPPGSRPPTPVPTGLDGSMPPDRSASATSAVNATGIKLEDIQDTIDNAQVSHLRSHQR